MTEPAPSPYLAQHIRDALAGDGTAELGIDVQVTEHGVYLSGAVTSAEQREDVEAVAAAEAAGAPVHNDIVIVEGEPRVEPEVLS